jgi:hypothetical protein
VLPPAWLAIGSRAHVSKAAITVPARCRGIMLSFPRCKPSARWRKLHRLIGGGNPAGGRSGQGQSRHCRRASHGGHVRKRGRKFFFLP